MTYRERHHAGWVHRHLCQHRAVVAFVILTLAVAWAINLNYRAIQAIQQDRAARIVAACKARHDAYLAIQRNFDLIHDLLHQGDLNDSRIPADLRALAQENRDGADRRLAEARSQSTGVDCTDPRLP